MMFSYATARILCFEVAAAVAVGSACSRAPEAVGIRGTVTFDAQPIAEGRVEFEPVPGSPAQRRDAAIRDGGFSLPANEGLPPGAEFRVLIKAFRTTGQKIADPNGVLMFEEYEQYLPEKYHADSALRITVNQNEQENQFEFNLRSQPEVAQTSP